MSEAASSSSASGAAQPPQAPGPAEAPKKPAKIRVKLLAVGNAPLLKRSKFLVSRDDEVYKLLKQIRVWLGMKDDNSESLFLYVNSSFAPGHEQKLGNYTTTSKRATSSS